MALRGEEYFFTYALTSDEGKVLACSTKEQPSSVLSGYSLIHPKVEKVLSTMKAGEEKDFILEVSEAYGPYKPNKIKTIKRSKLTGNNLQINAIVKVKRWWGEYLEGKVLSISNDSVCLDFNHKYAGMRLHYHIHLLQVKDISVPFACGLKPGRDE